MTTLTIPISPRLIYNRHVLLLTPTQSFLDWLTASVPSDPALTLAMVQKEKNTYLIPAFDDDEEGGKWVMRRWLWFFKAELGERTTDPKRWPELTSQLFGQFFDIEIHAMIFDVSGEALDIGD